MQLAVSAFDCELEDKAPNLVPGYRNPGHPIPNRSTPPYHHHLLPPDKLRLRTVTLPKKPVQRMPKLSRCRNRNGRKERARRARIARHGTRQPRRATSSSTWSAVSSEPHSEIPVSVHVLQFEPELPAERPAEASHKTDALSSQKDAASINQELPKGCFQGTAIPLGLPVSHVPGTVTRLGRQNAFFLFAN